MINEMQPYRVFTQSNIIILHSQLTHNMEYKSIFIQLVKNGVVFVNFLINRAKPAGPILLIFCTEMTNISG